MRAVQLPLPAGPVRVMVLVVDSCGVTETEPCACCLPRPGWRSKSVAFSEVQLSTADFPSSTAAGSAVRLQVGGAGGGGVGVGAETPPAGSCAGVLL